MDIYHRGIKFKKDPNFYDHLNERESAFGLIDPQAARARRDVLAPAFSRKSILNLEGLIQKKVRMMEGLCIDVDSQAPLDRIVIGTSTTARARR